MASLGFDLDFGNHALRAIGFELTGLGAPALTNTTTTSLPARTHMLLLDSAGQEPYVADVGYGGLTLTAPLRVEADALPREADRLLLARFAPACVLVNQALTILQFRGQTGPYLEPAEAHPASTSDG